MLKIVLFIPCDENISIHPWSEIFSKLNENFNGDLMRFWVDIGVWSHIDWRKKWGNGEVINEGCLFRVIVIAIQIPIIVEIIGSVL